MKNVMIILLFVFLSENSFSQKNVVLFNKAGSLGESWSGHGLDTIKHIKITGTINVKDILTLRDDMDSIQHIDLSDANIVNSSFDNKYYAANVLPKEAFYNSKTQKGKESLVSIILPYSLIKIETDAFNSCINLKKAVIHSNVTSLGYNVFSNCLSLEEVELSQNLRSIQHNLFFNCTSLKKINIPPTISIIGSFAFDGCTSLEEVNLPESLVFIDYLAFNRCTSLKEIFIPAGVSRFNLNAFCGTDALITFSPSNPYFSSVDSVVFDKKMEKLYFCNPKKNGDYFVPETVKSIEDRAFMDCDRLKTVTLRQSVDTIGDCILLNSNAKLIILPENERFKLIEGDSLYDRILEKVLPCPPKNQKPINVHLY